MMLWSPRCISSRNWLPFDELYGCGLSLFGLSICSKREADITQMVYLSATMDFSPARERRIDPRNESGLGMHHRFNHNSL
jgi:hypothetical protein